MIAQDVDGIEVVRVSANPAVSGTTTVGILRISGDTDHATDHGAFPNSPFGSWTQSVKRSDQSISLPYAFNPRGGFVGVYQRPVPLSPVDFGGAVGAPLRTVTASTTATDDDHTIMVANGAGAVTITFISPTLVSGRMLTICRDTSSTGSITIAGGGGNPIQALNGTMAGTTTLTALGIYGCKVTFQSDSTRWVRIT